MADALLRRGRDRVLVSDAPGVDCARLAMPLAAAGRAGDHLPELDALDYVAGVTGRGRTELLPEMSRLSGLPPGGARG